jgi:hypothetical protein
MRVRRLDGGYPTIGVMLAAGSLAYSRARATLRAMTTSTRRQWTDETIREELLPIATELGRFPRRNELTERGIGALWSAMGRRGGVDAWREVVAQALAVPASAPAPVEAPATARFAGPSEEEVRIAAYFMFQNGHPGGPESHWHAAQRELAHA